MRRSTGPARAFHLFVILGATMAASAMALERAGGDDIAALGGDWLYVEDLTEGREVEDQQPPMSPRFGFRVEDDAVVLLRGSGARQREERIPLDGSVREVPADETVTRYIGEWRDDALEYVIETVRKSDDAITSLIRREFRPTPRGLLVHVVVGEPAVLDSLALYRHPKDIELPEPAKATIADVAWITGAWVGTRGNSSIEERWGPPLGGALLGTSRTVSRGRMSAFEYLRIVERDGGLVYVAQPGGGTPTEFVLTEFHDTFAVFENPRHDSPQRIVYEHPDEDELIASIGFLNGGRPRLFEFERERE